MRGIGDELHRVASRLPEVTRGTPRRSQGFSIDWEMRRAPPPTKETGTMLVILGTLFGTVAVLCVAFELTWPALALARWASG